MCLECTNSPESFVLRAARASLGLLCLSLALAAHGQSPGSDRPAIHFKDVSQKAGLVTAPPPAPERRYLLEMMGGGVALFDCDNDGWLDILTVNDSSVERYLAGGEPMVTLYRQDPPLHPGATPHFTDTTASSGLNTHGWGMGIAIGDYDNDGLPDIYVTGYGHNVLYHNLGGCRFEDVTAQAGVAGGGFSAGAAWADYDRDGRVDLFVSRYVNTDIHNLPQPGSLELNYRGVAMEIPHASNGQTNLLYHNLGDGSFEDASARSGLGNEEKRLGMGVIWGDYDNDGWPDLFVTNDVGANYLFHNRRNGTFEDVALAAGTAVGEHGEIFGNMAADFADVGHNGRLDLLVTRSVRQPFSLYRNQTPIGFADATWDSRLGHAPQLLVRWGNGFADFDNDGWLDLAIANGGFTTLLDGVPGEAPFLEPLQLFRNTGGGAFTEVSDSSGLNTGPAQSRRGTAFGDVNNDGNVDMVVYNEGGPPSLFLNRTHNGNHRVLFRLTDTQSNKLAIGASVTVTTGKFTQMAEVRGGASYLSSNDLRLHFGLGAETKIDRVLIQWPSGLRQELKNLHGDAIYSIVEGQQAREIAKLPPPGGR